MTMFKVIIIKYIISLETDIFINIVLRNWIV